MANTLPFTHAYWFPNSCVSYHVTSDAKNPYQLTLFKGQEQIYKENGQDFHIHSTGYNNSSSPFLPHAQLTLNKLLLVPSMTKNLMSVSKFLKDNTVYFLFTTYKCLVKSQVFNVVLLKGHVGSDDLYELHPIAISNPTKSLIFPSPFSFLLIKLHLVFLYKCGY